uniref:ATP synthase subunit s-like protein n=1 Tax=Acrobeloides nanus TaxID=290746 RepID=A0A914CAB4_9BILA
MWYQKFRTFKRWQDIERERKEYEMYQSKVKNWWRSPETGMYIEPDNPNTLIPKKAFEDKTRRERGGFPVETWQKLWHHRVTDHSFDHLKRVKRYEHFQHLQYDQRFIPERVIFLGPDLAAAHFLVHRGAAVKFVGDDSWYKRDGKKNYSLPGQRVPGLYLEAIDASGTELIFEGFDNLYDLEHVRMLRLADCKFVNDWVMPRIGAIFSNSLEMLDLSGCNRISAKGLRGLRHLKKLKYLRLEGLDHVKDLAKSALLLEEAIPGLIILGVDFEHALKGLEKEMKILENERVVLDAKGNAHMEDDNGRLFYVAGCVNERPAVNEEDQPIMQSTIRREIPKMDDVEFERLDRLSGGKLRHLLVGSPGGYSWSNEVEVILSSEYKWKTKQGIHIDTKMLPLEKRKELFEKDVWDRIEAEAKSKELPNEEPEKITSDSNR